MTELPQRGQILRYLRLVEEAQNRLNATNPTDSRLRKIFKHAVPVKRRGAARMIVTNAVRPLQKRRADQFLAGGRARYLHVGSGAEHKAGWLNIDLAGDPVDLAWNLAHGIPFPDDTAEAVFHEHLFEHISLAQGLALMDECFRVLKPGGIVRVGVPDAGELLQSYAGDGSYVDQIHPHRPTRMLGVQELFYWHRHLTMYDEETLTLMVGAAGFTDVRRREFGDTELEHAPDTERRRAETLYVEGRKPTA